MATSEEVLRADASALKRYLAGDVSGAIEELDQVVQLAHSARDDVLVVSILTQKAAYLREMGRIDESRKILAEASDEFSKLPAGQCEIALPSLYLEKGVVARNAGDMNFAEDLLRQAADKAREHSDDERVMSLPDILANLATIYKNQGKLKDAQDALREAAAIDRKEGFTRALSNDLNKLAEIYGIMGDIVTQEQYLREALQQAMSGGLLKEAADALGNLAVIAEEAGRLDEAQKEYQRILNIYEHIGNTWEVANAKSSLGIVAAKKGDLAKAQQLNEEAYQLHLKIESVVFSVNDLLNLAQVTLNMNLPEQAFAYAQKATELAEKIGLLEVLWGAYWLVAKTRSACLKENTDPKQVVTILNNEVLPRYAKAADAVDLLRAGIGRAEEREYLLQDKESLYSQAILLAGTLQQPLNAFIFSERGRARAFLDVMGASRIERNAARDPLARRQWELAQQILALRGADSTKVQALLKELHLVRAEMSAKVPAIAAITEAGMPGPKTIFEAIPAKTALIEFYIDPGKYLTTIVITSQGIIAFNVQELNNLDIASIVMQFRAEVENESDSLPTGEFLFYLLFGNLWNQLNLSDVERLLIVPHRELHYVPFSTLGFQNSGQGPKTFYLSHRFTHSILPSAAFLPLCLNISRPAFKLGHSRVLGNPTKDLPFSEKEAEAVASLLRVKPLLQSQATRTSLLEAPQDLAIIHVASHGEYNENDALLSGIRLSDGLVTAEDFLEHRISTALLTLSGCVTAQAERKPGDELIGLTRAAAFAGVPSIITSLWNIEDEASSVFFDSFYRFLLQGKSKDMAMLLAQRALLSTKEFAHPKYWAPFVLFGDWR